MANSVVNTQAWKKRALDLKSPTFNAGHIALNTSGTFVPSATSLTSDITEPLDGGYARLTPTYGAAVNYGTGNAQIVAGILTWNFTYSAGTFTIYSVCQLDASGVLLWDFQLDTPAVISAAGPWQFVPTYAEADM